MAQYKVIIQWSDEDKTYIAQALELAGCMADGTTKDEDAAQLAGIGSALTSYESMVRDQQKAKNAFMDDLLVKRNDGSLSKYVAENNCKDKK